MDVRTTLLQAFFSRDANTDRLLRYWLVGVALYGVSLATLFYVAWLGTAPMREVAWLSIASIGGLAIAYVAIRISRPLGISDSALNASQSVHSICCILAAYALLGPMRGISLLMLTIVLVFGAFSSTRRQMRAICLFAMTALSLTILWKSQTDPARYPPQEEIAHFVLGNASLLAVAYLADLLSRLRRKLKGRTEELAKALARIQALATRDELTQLVNRRQMTEILGQDTARRQRNGETACLAVIDLDHFKHINDTRGHAAGDEVLQRFASQASSGLRRSDVLSRWGGEEFLLLMPDTRLDGAHLVLERMRTRVRETVRYSADPSLRVSFSAGVVEMAPGESFEVANDLADQAMYRAKREGRDRINLAPITRIPAMA